MLFILMTCFVALAVSIHRALSLKPSAIVPAFLKKELDRCDQYFLQAKASALYHALRKSNTPIGSIGTVALSNEFSSAEEALSAAETRARDEMVKLEGGMGVLEVIITIAPLLGLLGTVSGLVDVFGVFGTSDSGAAPDSRLIAAGIATALNTTIAGLVVAVIAVIAHSLFTRRLEKIASGIDVTISHLIHQFYKHGGPKLYAREAVGLDKKPGSASADLKQPSAMGALRHEVPHQRIQQGNAANPSQNVP